LLIILFYNGFQNLTVDLWVHAEQPANTDSLTAAVIGLIIGLNYGFVEFLVLWLTLELTGFYAAYLGKIQCSDLLCI